MKCVLNSIFIFMIFLITLISWISWIFLITRVIELVWISFILFCFILNRIILSPLNIFPIFLCRFYFLNLHLNCLCLSTLIRLIRNIFKGIVFRVIQFLMFIILVRIDIITYWEVIFVWTQIIKLAVFNRIPYRQRLPLHEFRLYGWI